MFAILILLLGLGVGLTVGLMGVGGGIVLVPALFYLLGFKQHMAQGTSLFLQLPPIGLGALITYWRTGNVDLRAGVVCAAGLLLGGYFGSSFALRIPSHDLRTLFGIFLMVTAMLLVHQVWTVPPSRPGSEASR